MMFRRRTLMFLFALPALLALPMLQSAGLGSHSQLLNVTHSPLFSDDFSNLIIAVDGGDGPAQSSYDVVAMEPGSWIALNIPVPEPPYEITAGAELQSDVKDVDGAAFEISWSEGLEPDFSNLRLLAGDDQGTYRPMGFSGIALVNGSWILVSLERPLEEGESLFFMALPDEGVHTYEDIQHASANAFEEGSANEETPIFIEIEGLMGVQEGVAPEEQGQVPDPDIDGTDAVFVPIDEYLLNRSPVSDGGAAAEPSLANDSGTAAEGILSLDQGEEPFFITLPVETPYPGGAGFSASVWIRTSAKGDAVALSSGEYGAAQSYWTMGLAQDGDSSVLMIRVDDGLGEHCLNGGEDLADGEWHHLAMIMDLDGCSISGYVDGELRIDEPICPGTIEGDSDGIMAGAANPYQDEWFNGELFLPATFDHALDSGEMTTLLSEGPPAPEGDPSMEES